MILIDNQIELDNFCGSLKGSEFITIDTEFVRETTYYPKLCLIQIANKTHIAAIDPLVEKLDLSKLFEILADENILKVFHSARQDLEVIYNISGLIPKPIFDTQIAAMFCGFEESISYHMLVYKLTSIQLDKTLQHTDWLRRPLTEAQLKYATADVTYLRDVYTKLNNILHKQNRQKWITSELEILSDMKFYESDKSQLWKKIKLRNKNSKSLYLIRELFMWRENQAQKFNIPRKHFIKDEKLAEIVDLNLKTIEQLKNIKNIANKYVSDKKLTEILQIIELSKDKKLIDTENKNISHADNLANNLFQMLLKVIAENAGIIPRLIISKDELNMLINFDDINHLNVMKGWKYDLFGKHALSLKKGKIALTMNKSKISIIKIEK